MTCESFTGRVCEAPEAVIFRIMSAQGNNEPIVTLPDTNSCV
jgi:hypothetical protein